MQCKNKYWLENLPDLFCSFTIVPLAGMDLEDQMNSLIRIVIIIFIVLILIDVKFAVIFLVISLIIITIFYYFYKNKMVTKENFTQKKKVSFMTRPKAGGCTTSAQASAAKVQYEEEPKVYVSGRETSCRFCNDGYPTGENQEYISINQQLAGKANPRTLIPPVITPKSHDLDYWRANNLVVHSHINAESFVDTYQSGYTPSNCCGYMEDKVMTGDNTIEYKPRLKEVEHGEFIGDGGGTDIKENFTINYDGDNCVSDNYSYPYRATPPDQPTCLAPLKTGQMNIACGYNPDNVAVNLPTNEIAGMCDRDPKMSNYNKNLYTQTIQPGVYSRSEIMQPINANIGISFQQQFEPVTCESSDKKLEYTLHDPRLVTPKYGEPISSCGAKNSCGTRVTNSNIYDPRDHGYGTSYRSYMDEMTGQPRYMYDDINAVRRPGYIVRSNVDFDPRMDHYGPVKKQHGLGAVKAIANDMFLRNSLKHRNSLMERYMEKQNTILAQRRKAPIRTSTSAGGCNRCKA